MGWSYCKPSREQVEALRAYAKQNGRTWKSALRNAWENGTASPPMMRLRSSHGPKWLVKYKLPADDDIHGN
jgi:hypothetical protein